MFFDFEPKFEVSSYKKKIDATIGVLEGLENTPFNPNLKFFSPFISSCGLHIYSIRGSKLCFNWMSNLEIIPNGINNASSAKKSKRNHLFLLGSAFSDKV